MTTSDEASIAIVNCPYERDFADTDALLARYHTLPGWAAALADAGAERVAVVQRFWKDDFVRRGRVDYHFVADGEGPYPRSSFSGGRVVRTVHALGARVVVFEGLGFPMVVRRLRWKLGRRAVIFARDHGGFPGESTSFRTWRGRAFYRFGLGAANGFLFTAREQAIPWLRAAIIRANHAVHELPEASTDLPSQSIARDREERLPGRPSLLWVGRLEPNQDPLTVLAGFERALAALPEAALTLVYGDDLLLPEVSDRIERSPTLRGRVHLRGRLDRAALPAVYAGADAFVLGSHREVACFSLIEALSFGLSPFVTDIPPFRVLTDGGRLGGLFAPGNAEELARVLARLGEGDLSARREQVGMHFERELSWPALGRRALALYTRS
jgi:glycosyltransferase involved in cell wall biosynthesis